MFRTIKNIMVIWLTMIIVSVIMLVSITLGDLLKTNQEMKSIIRNAHQYSVLQTQSIDIVKEQLQKSIVSRDCYNLWLNSMSSYSGLQNLKSNGYSVNGSSFPVSDYDDILVDAIIPFLKEDFSSSNYGYTPLNFGMTYLDPELLEKDMEYYIKTSIESCSEGIRWGRAGQYKVDPNTIKVKATLRMTPFRIDNLFSDLEKQRTFVTMFGLEIPDSMADANSKYLKRGQIKTVIKYDVHYDISWDYIPRSSLTRLRKSQALRYVGSSRPPEGLYFPMWFDKSGKVNSSDIKIKDARAKMVLQEPQEFNFEYVLTH